jgi:hypothetical protein
MVAGGFAAGYLLAWIACVGFDKTVVRGKSPDLLHRWARLIGGVLTALVVAFFVFRGGTGTGDGTGGDGPGTGPVTAPTSKATSPATTAQKPPEVAVDAVPVFVVVYAGTAVERGTEKFFAIGDPPGAKVELTAVADAVRAGQEKGKAVVVYSLDDTAATGTTGFLLLQGEAKARGVPLIARNQFDTLRKK